MKDYAVPINDVDTLIAHFAEWIKFLDAKGQELEAQLAKLEASKKKKTNGMEPSADVSVFQKVLSPITPILTESGGESASPTPMDWLDDGDKGSADTDKSAPHAMPQIDDFTKMDAPVLEADNPSDDEDETGGDTAPESRSDSDDKHLDWLKRK